MTDIVIIDEDHVEANGRYPFNCSPNWSVRFRSSGLHKNEITETILGQETASQGQNTSVLAGLPIVLLGTLISGSDYGRF